MVPGLGSRVAPVGWVPVLWSRVPLFGYANYLSLSELFMTAYIWISYIHKQIEQKFTITRYLKYSRDT